jgi:peptidoglycan/LPS O-acetylase OafA/YrhL
VGFTLGRRPALDGIRGGAIAVVVALHAGAGTGGGFLGVQVFFVLSGFVITAVLLEELRDTGAVNLRQFYTRRALRLAPALFAVLAFVAAYALLFPQHAAPRMVGRAEVATTLDVANWFFAHFGNKPYMLVHTWSLSVEEQFYLFWPPVLVALMVARGGYRTVARVAVAGVVASVAVRWLLIARGAGVDRVYLGTDTRVDALLIGCAVAVAFYAGWVPRSARALAALRWAGRARAVVVGLACLTWTRSTVMDFHGLSLTVIALCSAAVMGHAIVAPDGLMARLLAWSPLTQLGKVSYGLYLWHLPIFVMFRHAFPALSDVVAIPVMTIIALGVSLFSYRYIEEPFLRMKDRWRRPVVVVPVPA